MKPRNAEVCKLMHNAIRESSSGDMPQSIKEKDINEMIVSGYSQREIKSIISKNTFCCIRAFNQLVFEESMSEVNLVGVSSFRGELSDRTAEIFL